LLVASLPCSWAQSADPVPADPADEAPPASATADLGDANELVLQKKYAEAEALLAGLQDEFPDDPALLLMRGELLLALGKADRAFDVLLRASEVDPQRPRTHFQLASVMAAQGQRQAALEAFAREIELNDDPEVVFSARVNRAMLLSGQAKPIEAAGELESVLIEQPQRRQLFGDLIALYLEAGDLEQAATALSRGEQAGFLSAPHFYSVGARLIKDERYEEALALLEQALDIDPGLARAERSIAACLEKLGRDQEAVRHLSRYLELEPDAPDAEQVAEKLRRGGGS
jgi:tetratricopeptide (TPR) repeat protein